MDRPGTVAWRKSRRSIASGDCVEVASTPGNIAVRDSKDPAGPMLAYSVTSWRAFTMRARAGAFDAYKQ